MPQKVKLYSGTYKNYSEEIYKQIRIETFGEDIGQNSWLTAGEFRDIITTLGINSSSNVLEIASGSGGPAVFMASETGCKLTGVEYDNNGVENSKKLASGSGSGINAEFIHADASEPLPFENGLFDSIFCVDAINHLKNRNEVLKEFYRVLKPGGKLLYIDPVVVTGILSNEEIAIRSSIGYFLFTPLNENEKLLRDAGFSDIKSSDSTANIISISQKWLEARQSRKNELVEIEGEQTFMGLQEFFKMVHTLSSEKRLSRFTYTAAKI